MGTLTCARCAFLPLGRSGRRGSGERPQRGARRCFLPARRAGGPATPRRISRARAGRRHPEEPLRLQPPGRRGWRGAAASGRRFPSALGVPGAAGNAVTRVAAGGPRRAASPTRFPTVRAGEGVGEAEGQVGGISGWVWAGSGPSARCGKGIRARRRICAVWRLQREGDPCFARSGSRRAQEGSLGRVGCTTPCEELFGAAWFFSVPETRTECWRVKLPTPNPWRCRGRKTNSLRLNRARLERETNACCALG